VELRYNALMQPDATPAPDLKLLPVDPLNLIFAILFVGFGIFVGYLAINEQTAGPLIWILTLALVLLFFVNATLRLWSWLVARESALVGRGIWSDGVSRKELLKFHWPSIREIRYADMEKVAFMRVSTGVPISHALMITMKNGSKHAIALQSFRRNDCRSLAELLRSRGVHVYVESELLGKGFK
jgi:hypothetical protein